MMGVVNYTRRKNIAYELIGIIICLLVLFTVQAFGASYIKLADVPADQTSHVATVPSGYQCFVGTAINSAPEGVNESSRSNEVCENLGEGATVTLVWTAPIENNDGSELDDLTGFRLYMRDWTVVPAKYILILTVE